MDLVETLHELKKNHNISCTNIQQEDKDIYEFVRGDLVTCA